MQCEQIAINLEKNVVTDKKVHSEKISLKIQNPKFSMSCKIWFYMFLLRNVQPFTAENMKFSIIDFSSKCDQIRKKLRIWSHLLEKSLMENFIFLCSVWS